MRGSNATNSRIAIFTIALFCLGVDAAEAQIDSSNFSAYVTLTTDYVFRGISQTNEGPAVQGGFDFHHDIGIFLGIWASNVEFPMDAAQYNPRDIELDLYVGFERSFARHWSANVSLVRYTYPDSSFNFDYTEVGAGIGYRNLVFVNIAHTNDYFSLGTKATDYELAGLYPLARGFEIGATLGAFDIADFIGTYLYWNAGVSKNLDRFTFDVRYHNTDSDAKNALGNLAGDRWVFSISAAF